MAGKKCPYCKKTGHGITGCDKAKRALDNLGKKAKTAKEIISALKSVGEDVSDIYNMGAADLADFDVSDAF